MAHSHLFSTILYGLFWICALLVATILYYTVEEPARYFIRKKLV